MCDDQTEWRVKCHIVSAVQSAQYQSNLQTVTDCDCGRCTIPIVHQVRGRECDTRHLSAIRDNQSCDFISRDISDISCIMRHVDFLKHNTCSSAFEQWMFKQYACTCAQQLACIHTFMHTAWPCRGQKAVVFDS